MLGGLSPLPMQLGGGSTLSEKLYDELRLGLGDGGAGPVDGLEDQWRQAKALGLAKALSVVERAAMQVFPDLGVDHLPVYEAILALDGGGTLAARSEAAAAVYTAVPDTTVPALVDALRAIDPTIEIDTIDPQKSIVSHQGQPISVTSGPSPASSWPAYSQHNFTHVRWPGIELTDPEKRRQVERHLNRVLPSWVDYTIYNHAGFYLDGFNDSYLDITAMGG